MRERSKGPPIRNPLAKQKIQKPASPVQLRRLRQSAEALLRSTKGVRVSKLPKRRGRKPT